MRKRGEMLAPHVLAEVVLAMAIILAAFLWIRGELGGSNFERDYYSKDMALMSEVALGSPGVMSFNYSNLGKHDFEISLERGAIEIYDGEFFSKALFATDDAILVQNTKTGFGEIKINMSEDYKIE